MYKVKHMAKYVSDCLCFTAVVVPPHQCYTKFLHKRAHRCCTKVLHKSATQKSTSVLHRRADWCYTKEQEIQFRAHFDGWINFKLCSTAFCLPPRHSTTEQTLRSPRSRISCRHASAKQRVSKNECAVRPVPFHMDVLSSYVSGCRCRPCILYSLILGAV